MSLGALREIDTGPPTIVLPDAVQRNASPLPASGRDPGPSRSRFRRAGQGRVARRSAPIRRALEPDQHHRHPHRHVRHRRRARARDPRAARLGSLRDRVDRPGRAPIRERARRQPRDRALGGRRTPVRADRAHPVGRLERRALPAAVRDRARRGARAGFLGRHPTAAGARHLRHRRRHRLCAIRSADTHIRTTSTHGHRPRELPRHDGAHGGPRRRGLRCDELRLGLDRGQRRGPGRLRHRCSGDAAPRLGPRAGAQTAHLRAAAGRREPARTRHAQHGLDRRRGHARAGPARALPDRLQHLELARARHLRGRAPGVLRRFLPRRRLTEGPGGQLRRRTVPADDRRRADLRAAGGPTQTPDPLRLRRPVDRRVRGTAIPRRAWPAPDRLRARLRLPGRGRTPPAR